MGKKDNMKASMPIDDYRSKIGKQDWKKSKKEMKEIKQKSEAKKSSTAFTDMLLLVGGFASVVAVIYFGLYMYLQKSPDSDEL